MLESKESCSDSCLAFPCASAGIVSNLLIPPVLLPLAFFGLFCDVWLCLILTTGFVVGLHFVQPHTKMLQREEEEEEEDFFMLLLAGKVLRLHAIGLQRASDDSQRGARSVSVPGCKCKTVQSGLEGPGSKPTPVASGLLGFLPVCCHTPSNLKHTGCL